MAEYLDYTGLSHFKDKLDVECNKRYDKLWSMGEQLIINGNGIMGDNTNFSTLTFDPLNANGSAGSFTKAGHSYFMPTTDEYIPLLPNSKYELSVDLKSDGTANTIIYAMLIFYDIDKKEITAQTNMYIANTLTTLSQDLKAGDTVVHFTDLTNWNVTTTATHQHGFIFWNYTNSKGYTYPELTYSRNVFLNKYTNNSDVNKTNNTITLSSAWTGNTIPAGTKVSQSSSGNNYKYAFYRGNLPATWANYSGYYDGVDYSGTNVQTKMPPGTAYAKLGFLWNYQSKGGQIWATNISLKAVGRYLPLSGGTMAGTVKWNASSLPNKTSSAYAVVIDAFASGGEMGWRQLGTGAFNAKYEHPTTSGNKHIPSGGSSGQVLIWSSDGTATWGTPTGDVAITNAEIDSIVNGTYS